MNYDIIEKKRYFIVDGLKVHWNFKLLPDGFEAITLFGHIYDVQSKEDLRVFLETPYGKIMVNHERIHILQAESFNLKYFSFYILYIWYWLINLCKYGCRNYLAYHNIPFEREAYNNERDMNYSETHWKDYKD